MCRLFSIIPQESKKMGIKSLLNQFSYDLDEESYTIVRDMLVVDINSELSLNNLVDQVRIPVSPSTLLAYLSPYGTLTCSWT